MKTISKILADFQTFIEVIVGDTNEVVTFQIFKDKPDAKVYPKNFNGKVENKHKSLQKLNDSGAGIFMMINKGDLKGRSAGNVVEVRAVFADFDETPYNAEAMPLQPHLVVETSPGRHHTYWLISDCPLDSFTIVQKAIAARFGTDPTVVDLSRVMRVPGFYHQKGDPFLTHIVEHNDISTYTMEEIIEGLGLDLASVQLKPSKQPVSDSNCTGQQEFEYFDQTTGEVFDLVKWAKRHPDFLIVDALRVSSSKVLLGPPRDGKQHIRCPFHEEHTDQGEDLSTFCVNGTESNKNNAGFVIHCCHAHCGGRDRLDYIFKMLQLGWLPLSALTDKQFLAERRRPLWVKNYLDHWEQSQGYNTLDPNEQGQFLRYERMCLRTSEGKCKDDDWALPRQMGLSDDEWQEQRGIYIRSGLLTVEDGYLINNHILDTYESSRQAYEAQARGGREGGINGASR